MTDENKEPLDDDDKKTPGQIPLLNDIVFDTSLPLKAPPRPKRDPQKNPLTKPRKQNSYPPGYDPDTLDLFGDLGLPDDIESEELSGELRESADQFINDPVDEYSEMIGKRLREELTQQLSSILEDLNTRQKPEE